MAQRKPDVSKSIPRMARHRTAAYSAPWIKRAMDQKNIRRCSRKRTHVCFRRPLDCCFNPSPVILNRRKTTLMIAGPPPADTQPDWRPWVSYQRPCSGNLYPAVRLRSKLHQGRGGGQNPSGRHRWHGWRRLAYLQYLDVFHVCRRRRRLAAKRFHLRQRLFRRRRRRRRRYIQRQGSSHLHRLPRRQSRIRHFRHQYMGDQNQRMSRRPYVRSCRHCPLFLTMFARAIQKQRR